MITAIVLTCSYLAVFDVLASDPMLLNSLSEGSLPVDFTEIIEAAASQTGVGIKTVMSCILISHQLATTYQITLSTNIAGDGLVG